MSDTKKQIDEINEVTVEQMDAWMEGVFNEFDWETRNNPKVSEALKEIQEKLRPLEDDLLKMKENHKGDTDEAKEVEEKIKLLRSKLKEVYNIYKNK